MKPVSIGPFAGINNRLPDAKLDIVERGRKAGDYLRNAVNVDLTGSGTLRRRAGTALALAGSDVHSFWTDDSGAYFIDGDALCTLSQSFEKQVLRSGLMPGQRASFARYSTGDVYWSNNIVLERISNGATGAAGIPVPNPAPAVFAGTGGSLPAGLYQASFTAMSAAGEESGATWPNQIEVGTEGAIDITLAASSYDLNLYMSAPNGDILFFVGTLSAGTTSYSVSVVPSSGRQIPTLGLRPMPPGRIVREFNGRLLVAAGSALYYSEPYAPALYNPMRGYIPFPDRVTIVEPCEGGVYVAADKTYWLAGADIAQSDLVIVLPYGAVEGTGGSQENSKNVWWFSERGVVVGDEEGSVKNIQESSVAVEKAVSGAGIFREQNGVRQLVSSLFGTETTTAAASSFMEAEVIRKESML
jgi:hypothetical protein